MLIAATDIIYGLNIAISIDSYTSINKFYNFIFTVLINAVVLLLNCLVFILYCYIPFLSDTALKVS